MIELFRGFLVILHGLVDFASWCALLSYSCWLDFLFKHQYTEEDLTKLEQLRRDMKDKMRKCQLFLMSKYAWDGWGGSGTGCILFIGLAGVEWHPWQNQVQPACVA